MIIIISLIAVQPLVIQAPITSAATNQQVGLIFLSDLPFLYTMSSLMCFLVK